MDVLEKLSKINDINSLDYTPTGNSDTDSLNRQKMHLLWVEKYRPRTVSECILPDNIKRTFQQYVDKGEIPNLLLSGTAGVGKTTIAKALCNEIGCDYIVINGSDESGIDTFRNKIKSYAASVSLQGGRKVIIIDEADYLNANSTQPALRGAIEEFASNCSFIFTCNFKNRLIDAIHSRCTVIDFKINGNKQKMASSFFIRVKSILASEGITYDEKVVASVITKHFPDNRRILNELQRYAAGGTIDAGILAQVADVQIKDLVTGLKNKDFSAVTKWVVDNGDSESGRIIRKLFDSMKEMVKPQSIPQLVIILNKYDYQAGFVSDKQINLVAMMTEIMIELEFV